MKKAYLYEILECSDQILAINTIDKLKQLDLDINFIKLQSLSPTYKEFNIPKKLGGYRQIEAPATELKIVLKKINFYLQCVYYVYQTTASYGYIITPKGTRSTKNILFNAKAHLGCKFMINIDFENFFHQIKISDVARIFSSKPFQFDQNSAIILAKLCTYKGRLPMGAPTSPVLSNFYCITLDQCMQNWAEKNNIIFTRFVDDMTFSSSLENLFHKESAIQHICKQNGLKINPNKTKYFYAGDQKRITGLILRDTVDIADEFYQELGEDLERIQKMIEVAYILGKPNKIELIEDFKKEIKGQINFIGMIEGYDSPEFNSYRKKLKAACRPKESVFAARWHNLNYF